MPRPRSLKPWYCQHKTSDRAYVRINGRQVWLRRYGSQESKDTYDAVVGRAGWSRLCNLGLPELAASTPQEFVEIAVSLATDLSRLRELRKGSRQQMKRSPLTDAISFAREVEAAYRGMWKTWCISFAD